jgi:HK97 family phage major capsid protein
MALPIERADVNAMLSEAVAGEVISAVTHASAALNTLPKFNMGRKTFRVPIQSALASAGWVAEGSAKPETEVIWSSETLTAEEIAAIAVVHENVLADAGSEGFDLWGLIRPQIVMGFAKVIDQAVFFGTNKPASWPAGLVPAAVSAGNVVEQGTGTLDIDLSNTMLKVEQSGFDPRQWYTGRSLQGLLRNLRTTTGEPLYISSIKGDSSQGEIYGLPVEVVRNGAWPAETVAVAVVGDTSKALIGIRSDISFKLFDTGTVGSVSLLEKDMVAIRATMRLGFAVVKPVQTDGTGAYPFAVMRNATP